MRLKIGYKRSRPSVDDRRVLIRFAFFPIKVHDYLVWLERYKISQYYERRSGDWDDDLVYKWITAHKVFYEEKL